MLTTLIPRANRNVAVKILSTAATERQDNFTFERHILQRIQHRNLSSRHPGRQHVLKLLDQFETDSPASRHLCLVTEVLACTLWDLDNVQGHGRYPLPLVKHVTRQLLQALDFLHSECGVMHTGQGSRPLPVLGH